MHLILLNRRQYVDTMTCMKRGFTIIELLVVMAIIGMLASIMFVTFSTLQAKSRDTRRVEDIRELQKALGMYYISANQFPSSASPLVIDGTDALSTTLIASGAISGISGDPVSPAFDYTYQTSGPGSYTITFCLETDSIPNRVQGCANTLSN